MSIEQLEKEPQNFIRQIVISDIKNNKHQGKVVTRFPPEPNGYLHIGHAKSICLNFGIARDFSGVCHLRFDDTNPCKEDMEYINAIMDDVKWLGFDWQDKLFYASEYYQALYDFAEQLIQKGLAYVCEQTQDEIRATRGTLTEPGTGSPFRNRTVAENLDLFRRMKTGEFPDGSRILRAKIDMAHPNMNMRDPVLYRIRKVSHPKTGDQWCIYPMYDYAHPLSDMLESITHSICTLEFEDHRPLYDWFLDVLQTPCHPQQIEFARLNLTYTVMSKRKLLDLVMEKRVQGWDDPRMPTLIGMRRRGYTPASIRNFCEKIGVTKKDSILDVTMLEETLREDLNENAPRAMAVLRPIKVVIENYPENKSEMVKAQNHPQKPELGTRDIPFGKVVYIENDDFMENPPKGYHRLVIGGEVRLKYAYVIKATELIKNPDGSIAEIRATYDPDTFGGTTPDGRKIKGTIHWMSAEGSMEAEVRLYDRLFHVENPAAEKDGQDYRDLLNPGSLEILTHARVEKMVCTAKAESRFQFERMGYFVCDRKDHTPAKPILNRIVTLKDSWTKMSK